MSAGASEISSTVSSCTDTAAVRPGDAGGNKKLADVGPWLREQLLAYAKRCLPSSCFCFMLQIRQFPSASLLLTVVTWLAFSRLLQPVPTAGVLAAPVHGCSAARSSWRERLLLYLSMAGKAEYVQQIKNLQRGDPTFKQTWWDYCEAQLGGVRDPNRHDESILVNFVEGYNNGTMAPSAPRPEEEWWNKGKGKGKGMKGDMSYNMMPPPDMWGMPMMAGMSFADFVKVGQRASPHWKNAWQTYCALYGAGVYDPFKHDDTYHKSFIDYVGELAANGLSGIAVSQGINIEEITAQSKGKGKHSVFSMSMEPAAKRFRFEEPDGKKLELVEKVKNLQRSNPAAKEAWWAYCDSQCGGMRDPLRHDTPSLEGFLTSQGALA